MPAQAEKTEAREHDDGLIRIHRLDGKVQVFTRQELDRLDAQREQGSVGEHSSNNGLHGHISIGIWASVTCLFLVLLIGVIQI